MSARTRAIDDGVWRLRLDSECGLVVNAYALAHPDGIALIDTGFPHTTAQLAAGLAELDRSLADVTDVFYTHTHIDHVGGGAALAARWSPREWLWEGSTPAFGDVFAHITGWRTSDTWPLPLVGDAHGAHPRVAEIRSKPRTPIRVCDGGTLHAPRGVAFGDEVVVGPWRLQCVDARGHDPYHCAWWEPDRGWLFSGDVVLAVPTPLSVGMGDDAATWLRTLARWEATLPVQRLFPGHGMPTTLYEPSLARSRGRLGALYEVIADGMRAHGTVDLMAATERALPVDRSRFSARTSTVIATLHALLTACEREGWVTESSPGRWHVVEGELPPFDALW